MSDVYVGPIVLEVNGTEIEITGVSPTVDTGRKLVKTMNSTGRARGHVNGIATYNLTLEAVVPKNRHHPVGNHHRRQADAVPGGRRQRRPDHHLPELHGPDRGASVQRRQ